MWAPASPNFRAMAITEITNHTLIPVKEALAIITWVNYYGLYRGSRGTRVLTRFPHGLYSKEECEALRDSIIAKGLAGRERSLPGERPAITELV